MKKIIIFIVFFCLLFNCSDEVSSESTNETDGTGIIDTAEPIRLESISAIIRLVIYDSGNSKYYVVSDGLEAFEIKIDNNVWGAYTKILNDSIPASTQIVNGFRVSSSYCDSLAVINQKNTYENMTTAGQYAAAISGSINAGDHIAEIYKVSVKNAAGAAVEIKPRIFRTLKIVQTDKSITFGEIEIIIK